MIAKKKQLNISALEHSSLKVSLQKHQLSPLTSLQVQAVSFAVCKEDRNNSTSLKKSFSLYE